ncbi:histidine kinase [Streptomyces angustmyceticus]|uniref:histidine kinase n=1 Tax=Streptomyces angustmyceticus TaxID=285578 RepID=A0A5J4LAE3_9ACTN|nr:histidine kinase [Streptomyces angustmyceticus]GES28499.1 two-component sensor histidine kinase [Streptomyces angustmyceticus]
MTPDNLTAPARSGRHAFGARPLLAAAQALGRDLSPFRPGAPAPAARPEGRVRRYLPLVLAALAAVDLGISGTLITEGQPGPVRALSALTAWAQAPALVLALYRPAAAWWLSLTAALPYAIGAAHLGAAALDGAGPWPWTAPGLMAHLVVSLIVAGRVRPRVYVAQWALTLLVGGALTVVLSPRVELNGLLPWALLSAFGLVVVTAVRGWLDSRRELRKQEALTEFERSRRALLEERTRIARELHDVVAHHMSVVAVQAEAAPYRVAEPPQELSDSFGSIRENALAALTELRHILGMLRSEEEIPDNRYTPQPTLDNVGELVANVLGAGLRIDWSVDGTPRPVPQRVELSAYRIVQEALSNALRHAPGCRVELEIAHGPSDLGIRVANSPVVTEARRGPGTGHGLLGMRERASSLGGSVQAGPRADGWYEVRASLPTRLPD